MRLLVTLLLGVWAASGATYYVDYTGGSDANAGTSTNAAWKHHPRMGGWAGGSHTTQPGDSYIFKGGEVWPNSAMSLYLLADGTATNRIYFGYSSNWFSGAAFSRPVFDGGAVAISDSRNIIGTGGGTRNNMVYIEADYVTFDGFEIRNHIWNNSASSSSSDCWGVYVRNCTGVIVSNVYVHDWVVAAIVDGQMGGICGDTASGSVAADCTIKAPTSVASEWRTDANGQTSGVGVNGIENVINCEVIGTTQGLWGSGRFENCYVHDGGDSYELDCHENAVWLMNSGKLLNCVIANWAEGVGLFLLPGWSSDPSEMWVANCVVWGVPSGQPINLANDSALTGVKLWFVNNVATSNDDVLRVGSTKTGSAFDTLVIANNVLISDTTNQSSVIFIVDASDVGSNYTNASNVYYTPSQAAALGWTTANRYQPTNSIAALVDQGASFASITTTDRLGATRPAGSAWDIGAYEFGGVVEEPPPDEEPTPTAGTVGAWSVGVLNVGRLVRQ